MISPYLLAFLACCEISVVSCLDDFSIIVLLVQFFGARVRYVFSSIPVVLS